MKRQKDAFTDSVMKANHSLQIADWQRKYDEERWEKRSQQRMKETGAVIAVAFVVLVFGIWWRQRRRVHQLVFRLDENARRITENQTEIERLQQGDEASEQTIANLRRQIEDNRGQPPAHRQQTADGYATVCETTAEGVRRRHDGRGTAVPDRLFRPTAPEALAAVGAHIPSAHTGTVRLPDPSGRPPLRRRHYRPDPRRETRLPPHHPLKDQREGEVSDVFLCKEKSLRGRVLWAIFVI